MQINKKILLKNISFLLLIFFAFIGKQRNNVNNNFLYIYIINFLISNITKMLRNILIKK